ncbi:MAG: hypothetical protein EXQ55_01090 [Acidobacteria bacterium]|nr:hypothetical protein [Acidobacteriota bacterium]
MRLNSRSSWGDVTLLVLSVAFALSPTVAAQKYTFEEVAAGLTHQDAATRLCAIQILKDADYADAADPIGAALGDPDDRVQLAALDAERSLLTTRPVSRRRRVGFVLEVRSVSGGDAAEGQLALRPRTVPAQVLSGLAVALRDSNPRVRADAISLAALLAPVGCALGESKVQSPRSRVEPTELCSQVGNALVDNINSREPLLRRSAMLALGRLRYANAVQALSDQLSYYQKGADAVAASEGLAGIGHPTSASIFRQLLTSSNTDLRRLAVEGLARADQRDAPGSTPRHIVAALRESSLRPLALKYLLDLAPSMATVLGFSRDARIVAALEAATKDADPDVAAAAQQSIERLKIM